MSTPASSETQALIAADRIRDLLDDTVIDEDVAVLALAVELGRRVGARSADAEIAMAMFRIAHSAAAEHAAYTMIAAAGGGKPERPFA